jgi:hypothetical protein
LRYQNIGYIEFWGFFNEELGAETVASTMNFLNGTDALIIDLRLFFFIGFHSLLSGSVVAPFTPKAFDNLARVTPRETG